MASSLSVRDEFNKNKREQKIKKLLGYSNFKSYEGKNNVPGPAIFSLPKELLTEILALVASSSSIDLFNAKLSCKELCEATDDNYIYARVSLERIPVVPWRRIKEVSSFLNRCRTNGNPEALFRQGVVKYFGKGKLKSGLTYLNRAASSGHSAASHVLGVIYLCTEEYSKQQGVQLLTRARQHATLAQSRHKLSHKLREVIRSIWVNKRFVLQARHNCCPEQAKHNKREGWPRDDVDDDFTCRECCYNREAIIVCKMVRGIYLFA